VTPCVSCSEIGSDPVRVHSTVPASPQAGWSTSSETVQRRLASRHAGLLQLLLQLLLHLIAAQFIASRRSYAPQKTEFSVG
jgi:hypothetical protein